MPLFRSVFLSLFCLFPTVLYAQDSKPLGSVFGSVSLRECYELTIANSERLRIRDEEVKIAEAQYRQALAEIYPQLDLHADYTNRDNSDFGRVRRGSAPPTDDPSTPVGGNAGSLGRIQTGTSITVTQPIFTGFREFLLAEALEQQTLAARLQSARARELLYLDVSELFYQVVFAAEELKVVDEALKTLDTRIKDLREFIQLGKSRESEVFAARSDVADLQAVRSRITGLILASKELLSFLTGIPASSLDLSDDTTQSQVLEPLSTYLEMVPERSDIRASRLIIDAQEKRVEAARRARWPSVNFVGNAYGWEDPDRSREWEMLIGLDVPIFDGGRITARTDEEKARLRVNQLDAQERFRLGERDIKVAYANTVSARDQVASLKKLRESAKSNYAAQKEDYQNGVVTNLEVLQAIRQVQEAERRLLSAQQLYEVNLASLKIAAGSLDK